VTLIVSAILAVVLAPLAGVAAVTRHQHFGVAVRRLVLAALLFASGSAAVTIAVQGISTAPIRAVALSHATLAASTLALAALGALGASLFPDPLDAAASSSATALLITFGIVAAGPLGSDIPTMALNATLLVNPIIASAAAADIDLLRGDTLYRLSPIAHRRFDYPAWPSAFALHAAVAAAGFSAVALIRREHALQSPTSPTDRENL
jgi:hypothetical protein